MVLSPCTLCDMPAVEQVMCDYTNYAPEDVGFTNGLTDREYVHDLFDSEASSEMLYIGRDDEHSPQLFLSCAFRKIRENTTILYITNLFIKRSAYSNLCAKEAVQLLSSMFSDQYQVCVNVHSSARKMIDFWQKIGGRICPEFSVFTNTSNGPIMAIAYPALAS